MLKLLLSGPKRHARAVASLLSMAALLMAASPTISKAQATSQPGRSVSGTVTDRDTGAPVAGATILVQGRQYGTTTGADGTFTLSSLGSESVLQISFIGYDSQEISVGNRERINIVLVPALQQIDDVVVVGYGTMRKADLTGSVASVGNAKLVAGDNTNAAGALQGMIPGATITRTNNKPGGGYNVLIRGKNSITASTSPLWVIDGIPNANIEYINPDDIERIDVLKDASAAAIYGSSGANGVILVTTKQGKTGAPRISYSGSAGFRKYNNLPDMMSGDEYVQLAREAARAGNNNQYLYDEQIFTDPSELQAVRDHNYFDWLDAVQQTAFMTNHSVSASGGTENVTYTVAGGYNSEEGMISPQKYERYNMRAKIDVKVTDNVTFGTSLYYTHSDREKGNWDLLRDVFRMRPTQHPRSLVDGTEEWKYASNGLFNPLVTRDNQRENIKNNSFLGNIYLKLTFGNLDFTTSYSPNLIQSSTGGYIGVWTKALQGTAAGAQSSYSKYNSTNWVFDNVANYKWEKNVHRIQATGLFTMQKYVNDNLGASSKEMSYNSLWYNLGGGIPNNAPYSSYEQWSLMSYGFRVNYALMDKYLLTASLRGDGSSRLAEGHKWSVFPSVAVAWKINEEAFLTDARWLSELKLRLSYGEAGNSNSVSPYASTGNTSAAKYYPFGGNLQIGNNPANLANPRLSWERTSEYNAGIDFGIVGQRVTGTVEYYNRTTNDLIMNRSVPSHMGYTAVVSNIGSVRNSGVEFSLNTVNVRSGDFTWNTNFSIAYNKNRIISLADEEDVSVYSINLAGMRGRFSDKRFVGKPVDINWNYKTIGVWQLGEEQEAARYGAIPGQFRRCDFNDDGRYDENDRFIDGKQTPHLMGGMTNTFVYKNLDLSIHMYFQAGARAHNQFFTSFALEGNNLNFNNLRKDYWTPENPSNTMAQPSNFGSTGNIAYEKTDFLKVAYISLGYTFRHSFMDRIGMKNLRVYATVQNPLIFTKFTGPDPEQPSLGNLGESDAMTVNVLFGINVSF